MRKDLIAAVSAVGLMMGGAAFAAQDTAQTTTTTQTQASQSEYLSGQPHGTAATELTTANNAASVENMMGRDVVGSDGERIGSVEDVILNPQSGAAEQLVISSGGILGIGARSIAVDFADASLEEGGDTIRLSSLTAAQAEELPEFDYDDSIVSLSRGNADTVNAGDTGAIEATPATPPTEAQRDQQRETTD